MPAPIHLAPHQTCPGCGWTGHDWAFRYQPYCKKCYGEWKKEQRRIRAALRPKNENVSLGPDLVITRNVERRLMRTAQAETPVSPRQRPIGQLRLASTAFLVGGPIIYHLLDLNLGVDGTYLFVGWWLGWGGLFFFLDRFGDREGVKRFALVRARLTELAEERKRRAEERDAFYASPEWKLLRESIIKEQGRVCRHCEAVIKDDFELAVDHMRPRSKYPHLALSRDNLQVLCRSCNASKGDRELD